MPDSCIANTACGPVRGECAGGVRVWRGIPYAAAPEGGLRFRRPRPAAGWEGLLDATGFGPMCTQARSMEGRAAVSAMSEDCLTLNIWAPAEGGGEGSAIPVPAENGGESPEPLSPTGGGKRPVLFYIHGGSFLEGAGSDSEYDGANLAREGDVVVVTINYRLGVFGFMDFSFLGDGFSANCGIWDIIAALRWVNENIGAFGGDAGNVTACGQSAGATCASILPMVGEAAGYIKQVIMMSAVPILFHSKEEAQRIARRYMEFMGLPDADSLMGAPADVLAAGQKGFAHSCGLGTSTYGPCVDGEGVASFPIRAAADGRMAGIPALVGVTRDELSILLKKSLSELFDVTEIRKMGTRAENEDAARRISGVYKSAGRRAPAVMMTDFIFHMPCLWFAEAYGQNADAWMYRFDYQTLGMRVSGLRSFHSSDIPFLFGNFDAGLAHYMMLITPCKKWARKVYRELQGDFLAFMWTGELPWEKCGEGSAPAKFYAPRPSVGQLKSEEVKRAFDGSEIKRKSLAGEDIVTMQ